MKRILDAKFSKADLKTIAERSTHLDPQERYELYTLLKKYESLLGGNLGIWHGTPYDIKLKPDAEPFHEKNIPLPHIHEPTFKEELDQLKALKVNASKLCFGAHKIEFLGYYRESQGHSIPCSSKNSQKIAPFYRYDQLLPWHVEKGL